MLVSTNLGARVLGASVAEAMGAMDNDVPGGCFTTAAHATCIWLASLMNERTL
jgi:hypothetical protein